MLLQEQPPNNKSFEGHKTVTVISRSKGISVLYYLNVVCMCGHSKYEDYAACLMCLWSKPEKKTKIKNS